MEKLIMQQNIIVNNQHINTYTSCNQLNRVGFKKGTVADPEIIQETLNKLFAADDILEIRAIDSNGKVYAGFFDKHHHKEMISEIVRLNDFANVFIILNHFADDSTILEKYQNINVITDKNLNLTKSSDIKNVDYFLVDIDPVRPTGVSSTNEELNAAWSVCDQVRTYLSSLGFNCPIIAMSGNGYHILYPVIDKPLEIYNQSLGNKKENEDLFHNALKVLALKFNNDQVKIDTSVAKAGQLIKFYGTVARKGQNTAERPHRLSRIIYSYSDEDSTDPLYCEWITKSQLENLVITHLGALKINNRQSQSSHQPLPYTPKNLARVISMLKHIDADCSYETYRDTLWGLCATGFPNTEELGREWSLTAEDRFNETTFKIIMNTYDPSKGIHFGTLFFLAKEGGYRE
jgi:hypothetical protein